MVDISAEICITAQALLGLTSTAKLASVDTQEVAKFISERGILCLKAFIRSGSLTFYAGINSVQLGLDERSRAGVYFVKLRSDITDLSHVVVSSVSSEAGIAQSLQATLTAVYLPSLLEDPSIDEGAKAMLTSLQGALARLTSPGVSGEPTAVLPTALQDEVAYWEEQSRLAGRGAGKARADAFLSPLLSLSSKLASVLSSPSPLPRAIEWVGEAEPALDELWRAGIRPGEEYPQQRMRGILAGIGTALEGLLRATAERVGVSSAGPQPMHPHPLWTAHVQAVRAWVDEGGRMVAEWTACLHRLTKEVWPHLRDVRAWNGDPSLDPSLTAVLQAGMRVLDLRRGLTDVCGLLAAVEAEGARAAIAPALSALHAIPPLSSSPSSQSAWLAALHTLDSSMAQAEEQAGEALGRQINEVAEQPAQLLALLHACRHVFSRPALRTRLSREFDLCRARVSAAVGDVDAAVARRMTGGRDTAALVESIIWAQGAAAHVQQLLAVLTVLSSGSQSQSKDDTTMACEDTLVQLGRRQREVFSAWCKGVESGIREGRLGVDAAGRVLEFDPDGNVRVRYGEGLVAALREARQLAQLGFQVPDGIRLALADGERFLSLSSRLARIAAFYNTLGSEIIPTTKPMLLRPLLAFESMVQEGGAGGGAGTKGAAAAPGVGVVWSDAKAAIAYVDGLQAKAEAVSTANDALRMLHARAIQAVVALAACEPLRQREAWKAALSAVKDVANDAISRYGRDTCTRWLTHMDWQVYKGVEGGYAAGLELLPTSLSDLKTDVLFLPSAGGVTLRPSVEDLRALYYAEARRFIALPAACGTMSGQAQVEAAFMRMAAKSSSSLLRVYHGAEVLFARVARVRDSYRHWAALGIMAQDAQAWVEDTLKDTKAFEAAFTSLRNKQREVERLPDFTKVDCVSINLSPFKVGLDGLLRSLHEACALGLRRVLMARLAQMETYLDRAQDLLHKRPDSLESIAAAQAAWKVVTAERTSMITGLAEAEEQRRLLASVVGGTFDMSDVSARLARLSDACNSLETSVETFTTLLEEARSSLKSRLTSEVADLCAKIERSASRWAGLKNMAAYPQSWAPQDVAAVMTMLEEWKGNAAGLQASASTIMAGADSFGVAPPVFPGLEALFSDIEEIATNWAQYKAYNTERLALCAQDWLSFRAHLFDLQDWAGKWAEVVHGRSKGNPVAERIATQVDSVKRSFSALKYARGDPFQEEHWAAMFKRLGVPRGIRVDTLTVGHVLEAMDAVGANMQFLKDLTARAQGEVTLREALSEAKAWADTAEFKLQIHISTVDGRTVPLIKEWRELGAEIGDNRQLLMSLRDSPYFRAFADVVDVYEDKLCRVEEAAGLIASIQRRWVYLEPVFARGALPSEAARFRRVDDDFRGLMGQVGADSRVLLLADASLHPDLTGQLKQMADQLERCQKALAEFLEAKRGACPRFYFLGDDDLLEILGQASNPAVIQSHLKKLFQGVSKVQFSAPASDVPMPGKASSSIVAMCSASGEVVQLRQPVSVTDDVTTWVNAFSAEMAGTLRHLTVQCCAELKKVRAGPGGSQDGWEARLARFPSQVSCLAEQVSFTAEVEAALAAGGGSALSAVSGRLSAQLGVWTGKDWRADVLMSLKTKALILDVIHHLDVVEQLVGKEAKDPSAWIWQKQLRVYLSDTAPNSALPSVHVRMVDADMEYTYEYQGNAPKLVHTPLTDKCYLVLTQGLQLGFGGNPYGPAGTGKTESVKALGSAAGRQVLVFNCDEGIDFASMGRIFTGIVRCGAWGCFDEFNRLREDQLSAISSQIALIQEALKEKVPNILLLGATVPVDHHAGIFVTLNPAGKGYGGRSRLPDNLKALFRPVAMSKPDNELIAETVLASEGFTSAKELGRRVVSLFSVSAQLLSHQQHYDWGLRALKAVLNTAGSLLAQARAAAGGSSNAASDRGTCTELLIRAIRVNTLSKLTSSDASRFNTLCADVFSGTPASDMVNPVLESAVKQCMQGGTGWAWDEGQARKILQLKESLDQRMGCVLVGPSGCGKSTVWRALAAALGRMGQPVTIHSVNPKSMPRAALLGFMDHDTREWTDGVLTAAARAVVREAPHQRCWIVLDGDVDPEWIEALNSVLDDNHLLTLPNGERIAFGSNVNFLFETHDLRWASPATVSRCGMIFLSDADVDVHRLTACWLAQQAESAQSVQLSGWLDDLFYRALDWVRASSGVAWDTTLLALVKSGLSHVGGASSKADFAVGLIRGLGCILDIETRKDFARDVLEWAGVRAPDGCSPIDCYSDGGTLRPYKMDAGTGASAALARIMLAASSRPDASVVPDPTLPSPALTRSHVLASVAIPIVSVQRAASVLAPWMEAGSHILLVGHPGCGKGTLVKALAACRRGTGVSTLHCNAATGPADVVARLKAACAQFSAGSGRVYRPKEGDRLVLILKDIDLPRPDRYDTCALVAFLQQLLVFGGFYEGREFVGVERVQVVATAAPLGTLGRHRLSPRFTAALHVCAMNPPDAQSGEQTAVVCAYLQAVMGLGSGTRVADPAFTTPAAWAKLASCMVEIYSALSSRFTLDDARHYVWSPRGLTAWVHGLLRYPLDTAPGSDGSGGVVEAVVYEAARCFRDRLVHGAGGAGDALARYDGLVAGVVKAHWGIVPDMRGAVYVAGIGVGEPSGLHAGVGSPLTRVSRTEWISLATRAYEMYEREERELCVTLTGQACEALGAVRRVLTRAGGSAVMVGRSGVGRRSAAVVAAHMQGARWVTPAVGGQNYSWKTWSAELKGSLVSAGVACEEVVLFVEDHQLGLPGGLGTHVPSSVPTSAVLEALNSLLAGGEVPGLFTAEELDAAVAPLKEEWMAAAGEGRQAAGSLHDFFYSRVRSHLHVLVSLDPTGLEFHGHMARNPALVSRAAVIWMGDWRAASLRDIAVAQLSGESTVLTVPDGSTPQPRLAPAECADMAVAVHGVAAGVIGLGVGPRDFVALLRTFNAFLVSQRGGVSGEVRRLRAGLARLSQAQASVDELTMAAGQQRAGVREKQAAADAAMTDITEALSSASDRRHTVEVLQRAASKAEADTLARKATIEGELAEITPILEQAKTAVGAIRKDNLEEIRTLKTPPEAIADVLSAVLVLLGESDTSWAGIKVFLGRRGVIADILSYDARHMSQETRAEVGRVMMKKAESFKHEVIYRASVAAAPLAAWAKANLRYSLVLEKIAPLEADLNGATAELHRCSTELSSAQAEISTIDVRVGRMKGEFSLRTAEAETLKAALVRSEDILARAQALLVALSGEQTRWAARVQELSLAETAAPLQALMSAAFLTYAARGGEDVRAACVAQWAAALKVAAGSNAAGQGGKGVAALVANLAQFDVVRSLAGERETMGWRAQGMPADALSMENGAVLTRCAASQRCAFLVDPGGSATEWLVRHLSSPPPSPPSHSEHKGGEEGGHGGTGGNRAEKRKAAAVEVVVPSESRFPAAVDLAVRFGRTLIVRDTDGVPALLVPLLRRDFVHTGPRSVVQVGDKSLDVDEGCTLYLSSRNPSPILPPDMAGLLTLVNFSVTRSGLEGQLLGETLSAEQPELEASKRALLAREEELHASLGELEERLLASLASSTGSLLDNKELLSSLAATKTQSEGIQSALAGSARASDELEVQRNVYRPFAHAGALLFFVLASLHSVNPLYRFSLSAFTCLFRLCLAERPEIGSGDVADPAQRVKALVPALERRVLSWTCRSLAKTDRLWFALHLVRAMHGEMFGPAPDSRTESGEWRLFMGDGLSGAVSGVGTDLPPWAGADRAGPFHALAATLPDVVRSLELMDVKAWGPWAASPTPELASDLPLCARGGGGRPPLSSWHTVLLVQALRPDRLTSALNAFVCGACGLPVSGDALAPDPASVTWHALASESAPTVPILLITTAGADPTRELTEYACAEGGKGPGKEGFTSMAMGGGVTDAALKALRSCAASGGWLYLSNLHMVSSWLPTLAKELTALEAAGRVHAAFRLWASTETHPAFPPSLAAGALKVSVAPPPGLRANMERTLAGWSEGYMGKGSPARAALLFTLALFHATVQERRAYVPQGWTQGYEFGMGDLRAGAGLIDALLPPSPPSGTPQRIPWAALHGLLENAVYGGRVDNAADTRILRAYLASLLHPDVLCGKVPPSRLLPTPLPSSTRKGDYTALVQAMSTQDAPALFGLPDNADRAVQRADAARVVVALKLLRPSPAAADGSAPSTSSAFDREEWGSRLMPLIEAWDGLMRREGGMVRPVSPAARPPSSDVVVQFVSMEADLTGRLTGMVHADMGALRKLLSGTVLLTPALAALAASCLSDTVPPAWREAWDGPEGVVPYLAGLAARRTALAGWEEAVGRSGTSGSLLSQPRRLSDLCHPAAFLSALRQQTCRVLSSTGTSVSLDALRLVAAWGGAGALATAPLPMTVEGLLVAGAGLDAAKGCLVDVGRDAPEVGLAPPVTLAWVTAATPDPVLPGAGVPVPLYATMDRTRALAELSVPYSSDKAKWILAGVALFIEA